MDFIPTFAFRRESWVMAKAVRPNLRHLK